MYAIGLAILGLLNVALFKWHEISTLSILLSTTALIMVASDRSMQQPGPSGATHLMVAATVFLLTPVAALSWLTLALCSFHQLRLPAHAATREALKCVILIALTELLTLLLTKLRFSLAPLLELDAYVVQLSLQLLGADAILYGNHIQVGTHHGVVLWSCTGIRSACLVVITLRLSLALIGQPEIYRHRRGLVVALASLLLNHARVVLSALSPEWHARIHASTGMMIYDSAQVLLVMLFLLHYAKAAPARDRMR